MRSLNTFVAEEVDAMARHALGTGLSIPAHLRAELAQVSDADAATLLQLHAKLVRVVAPAHPASLVLFERARTSRFGWLGAVWIVRVLAALSVASTLGMVLLALSPYVNGSLEAGDAFHSEGLDLLVNQLFYACIAGMGAGFYNLYTAERYVRAGTYDPRFDATYVTRFVLGVVAGMMLVDLLGEFMQGLESMGRPLLALGGGFSASVVYSILDRLTQSLEAMVKVDLQGRLNARSAEIEATAAAQKVQSRTRLAQQLAQLQARLSSSDGTDAHKEVGALVDKLLEPTDDAA